MYGIADFRRGLREAPAERELAIDLGLSLASFLLAVVLMASGGFGAEEDGARGADLLGVTLALISSAPLLARRRAIVPVYLTVFAAYFGIAALKYPIDVMLGPMIALYTLAGAAGRTVPRLTAVALGVLGYLTIFAGIAIGYELARVTDVEAIIFVLVWVVIWVAGERAELRRDQVAWLEERARHAEEEAEGERRLAAAEERTRIARDLHDSAGHAINVILMQAGAARVLRERDPERSEQAIRTIEEVAREQIAEIDRLVHALRAEDRDVMEDCRLPGNIPMGPAAGEALLERMRESGLDLETHWHGEHRHLGPTVGRTAFRILQEGLTNASRHGTGSATVDVRFDDDAVVFTIENPVARPNGNPPSEGHGLTGMRERAALVGGSVEAEEVDGTFRVRAVLPYDPHFDEKLAKRQLEEMAPRNGGRS